MIGENYTLKELQLETLRIYLAFDKGEISAKEVKIRLELLNKLEAHKTNIENERLITVANGGKRK